MFVHDYQPVRVAEYTKLVVSNNYAIAIGKIIAKSSTRDDLRYC